MASQNRSLNLSSSPVHLLNPGLAGNQVYRNRQQTGPYRGGLQSDFDFSGIRDVGTGAEGFKSAEDQYRYGQNSAAFRDSDADVRGAAEAAFNLQNPGAGVDTAAESARYNMYKGRIGTKNSLAEQIANSERNLRKQEDLLTQNAGQALGEGVKNTRQNYNSRGLLYSGLRQGGEQQVKQGVASSLNAGVSGAKQDAYKSRTSAQNAYAAVDLANAQESLNMAHQAFDTATRNSIARMQAMQQLGQGVGAVAGAYYGSQQQPQQSPGAGASVNGPAYNRLAASGEAF